ncbi:hypothetical protein B0H13DRAFT_1916631 [Mycena leptocephala]|nr:hypothetical protein B0H13DRAFT_1916631 [Mycena leptocephala]
MPVLTRPRTPESIHSWWSDSNPVGPTISIHAVAKPLMKRMYQEQVRSFIKRNHGTLLSRATLEICISYLAYVQHKYISPATKTLILKELAVRAEVQDDPTTMLDSFLAEWDLVVELLSSSDSQIRRYTCNVLGALVSSTRESRLVLDACEWIVSLLRYRNDDDIEVREAAIRALAKISRSSGGAHAVGNTTILDHVAGLLDFEKIRFATLDTLSNLVFYRAIPEPDAVLRIRERITPFLRCSVFFLEEASLTVSQRDPDSDIRERAIMAAIIFLNR